MNGLVLPVFVICPVCQVASGAPKPKAKKNLVCSGEIELNNSCACRKALARENWGQQHKTIATITEDGGTFKSLTVTSTITVILSIKLLRGFHLLSTHLISFGQCAYLFCLNAGCKSILKFEDGENKNQVSVPCITLHYKLSLH